MTQYGEVFVKQNDSNCMIAAITNAVDIVAEREIANAVNKYCFEESPHFLKIREATLLLHELATGAEMRKIPTCDAKVFKENPFAYLASRDSGVYLVYLFQPNLVSHTLVVDAGRKHIIDSAEYVPMRLSESLLRKCGGEAATAPRIGEVRKIVSQRDR